MVICSHRTTTTFWPPSSSFATTDASRPSRWPRPSTVTGASNMMEVTLALGSRVMAATEGDALPYPLTPPAQIMLSGTP